MNSERKLLFEHGTSMMYVGNLMFRLLHSVLFSRIEPRNRVVISLLCGSASMLIIIQFYWVLKSKSVVWVFISYFCGGIGIGTFESNLLSTITPLGNDTKLWAMCGITLGFSLISIVGYLLMGIFNVDVIVVYIITGIACFISILIWKFCIPVSDEYNSTQQCYHFMDHIRDYKNWFLIIITNCLSILSSFLFISFFSAANQYILDGQKLPLFGEHFNTNILINTNDFFAIYQVMTVIGDLSGRKIMYSCKPQHNTMIYIVFPIMGGICCVLKIPILTLLGICFIFLGNGLIYCATTLLIDNKIKKEYQLTSLSIFLFAGDIGSIIGSNIWQHIQPIICNVNNDSIYFC